MFQIITFCIYRLWVRFCIDLFFFVSRAVSCTQQSRQREPSVKTFCFQFFRPTPEALRVLNELKSICSDTRVICFFLLIFHYLEWESNSQPVAFTITFCALRHDWPYLHMYLDVSQILVLLRFIDFLNTLDYLIKNVHFSVFNKKIQNCEPNVKSLRFPISADFLHHCVLRGGNQRRTLLSFLNNLLFVRIFALKLI